MGKNAIPDRWESYLPIGKRVEGTRFIAFKVPLHENLSDSVDEDLRLDIRKLLKKIPNLGAIVDLTNTNRYYNPEIFESTGVEHFKLMIPGHATPPSYLVKKFKMLVRNFLQQNMKNDTLIGVHCTHGINRTGYLICNYMITEMAIPVEEAIRRFGYARGYKIERENYIEHLRSLMPSIDSERRGSLKRKKIVVAREKRKKLSKDDDGDDDNNYYRESRYRKRRYDNGDGGDGGVDDEDHMAPPAKKRNSSYQIASDESRTRRRRDASSKDNKTSRNYRDSAVPHQVFSKRNDHQQHHRYDHDQSPIENGPISKGRRTKTASSSRERYCGGGGVDSGGHSGHISLKAKRNDHHPHPLPQPKITWRTRSSVEMNHRQSSEASSTKLPHRRECIDSADKPAPSWRSRNHWNPFKTSPIRDWKDGADKPRKWDEIHPKQQQQQQQNESWRNRNGNSNSNSNANAAFDERPRRWPQVERNWNIREQANKSYDRNGTNSNRGRRRWNEMPGRRN